MIAPDPAPRPERRRDPLAVAACHAGRIFPSDPVSLGMLRALGVDICPSCNRALRIRGKTRWVERP